MFFTIGDFIAGWIGGVCGLIIGHPLDTVKVRQQAFGSRLFTATSRTYRHEGFRGFYKGMLFPAITLGPSNAVFFGTYGNVMKTLQQTEKQNHKISPTDYEAIRNVVIAGTVAGFFQALFTCPVELVKTVLQTKTDGTGSWVKHFEAPYKNSFQAFAGILKSKGIKGMYHGWVPTIIRDVPTSGLYVLTYEMLLYSNFSKCDTPRLVKQMVAGGTAGLTSWMLVIPFDVIKSRIQADNPDNPSYKGTLDCIYKTYKTNGLKFFFKGTTAILLRTFPVNAATFIGYETVLGIVT